MAAYKKNENGSKMWLVESKYGGWILQYRPTKQDVKSLVRNQYPVSDPRYESDVNVYSIKVKEIERKKLFSIKAGGEKMVTVTQVLKGSIEGIE